MITMISSFGWAFLAILPLISLVFWTLPGFDLAPVVNARAAQLEDDDLWARAASLCAIPLFFEQGTIADLARHLAPPVAPVRAPRIPKVALRRQGYRSFYGV